MSGAKFDLPSDTLDIVLEISMLENEIENAILNDQQNHVVDRLAELYLYLDTLQDPYNLAQSQHQISYGQQHFFQTQRHVPQGQRLMPDDQDPASPAHSLNYAEVSVRPARVQPAAQRGPLPMVMSMDGHHEAKKSPTQVIHPRSSHTSLGSSHTSEKRNRLLVNENTVKHKPSDDRPSETKHEECCDGCKEVPKNSDCCRLDCGHVYCRECVPMFFEAPEMRPERCC
ncbi:MAG: hypothetical protein Q9160_008199 [Pyrenula sp. 1 TL-2023]